MQNIFSRRCFSILVLCCFLLLLTLSSKVQAFNPTLRFNNLSIAQGLPNKSVSAIAQDHQGFIWLGTLNGLSRYDGYQLKTFFKNQQRPGTLSENTIRNLLVDSQGTLWIATGGGGLNRFDSDLERFDVFSHQTNNPNSLSNNIIRVIAEASENQLWIGTDSGLDLFDKQTGRVTRFQHSPDNPDVTIPANSVRAILKTRDNALWVGTASGLAVQHPSSAQFSQIKLPFAKQPALRALLEDRQGDIWIATVQGLFKYHHRTGQISVIADKIDGKRMLSLLQADDGTIWAGSTYHGLFSIDNDDEISQYTYDKSDPDSLADNVVMSLFQDNGGMIWAGTFTNGVSRTSADQLNFGLSNSNNISCLTNPVVRTFAKSKDNTLWFGTQDGLIRFKDTTSECRRFAHDPMDRMSLPGEEAVSLLQEEDQLWVGTSKGLARYLDKTEQFELIRQGLPEAGVDVIARDNKGRLLVGTPVGLYVHDKQNHRFNLAMAQPENQQSNRISAVEFDANGALWVATDKGLARFDDKTDTLLYLNQRGQKHIEDWLYGMHADEAGNLYIATISQGLKRLQLNTEQMFSIDLSEYLPPTAQLFSILPDSQNSLWISSSHGLLQYRPTSGKAHLYRRSDGLQSDTFFARSGYKAPDGQLYFGGVSGFNRFYPKDIEVKANQPKLALTKMTHFNQLVEPAGQYQPYRLSKAINRSDTIELNYQDYVFGFEFSVLDFADPQRNRYAYQMVGVDPDWNFTDAGNRRASYTNLDAGNYVFRVKGAGKNGIWSAEDVTLNIKVNPAPWATWWAYTSYLIIILATIVATFKYRTSSLQRRAHQLEQSVTERTKELADEKRIVEQLLSKKNDEFANVSHEFRTPLTLVLGPVAKLLKQESNPQNQTALEVVKRNAYRLLRMVDQLLDMEKFRVQQVSSKKTLPLKPMFSLIAQSFVDLAQEKHLQLKVGQIDDAYLSFTQDAMEKILLNLISNAIKYTLPGGFIYLSAKMNNDNQVVITVTDTGIGIAPNMQDKVFERFHRVLDQKSEKVTGAGIGLALVKELVEAHQGQISLTSELEQGTTIEVTLPTIDKLTDTQQNQTNQQIIDLELESLSEQHNQTIIAEQETIQQTDRTIVLIVEDNPDMRDYIHGCLSDEFHCLLAANGQAGFEIAQKQVPDLIVSDVMMPVMDGYQLTKAVKSDDKTSHIPVVLLTARGDKESRLKGWYEKADEYLTKPFDPDELLIRINNLLAIRDLLTKRFSQTVFEHVDDDADAQPEPEKTPETQKLEAQQQFLHKLNEAIETLYQQQQTKVPDIAAKMNMGEWQLLRKLKGTLDMTVAEYLRRYRLEKACELLKQGESPNIVALEVGFASHSYFTRCFSAQFGCSPSQYRG